MKIKTIAIYVQLEDDSIHQVATSLQNKLMSLETIRVLNEGKLPLHEKKEDFEFEDILPITEN